jgi:hypothetical protein
MPFMQATDKLYTLCPEAIHGHLFPNESVAFAKTHLYFIITLDSELFSPLSFRQRKIFRHLCPEASSRPLFHPSAFRNKWSLPELVEWVLGTRKTHLFFINLWSTPSNFSLIS